MHKEYCTVTDIIVSDDVTEYVIHWKKTGISFRFNLPKPRMVRVFSGLMDVLRKEDSEEPNTTCTDFRRGVRLAEGLKTYSARHDVPLFFRDIYITGRVGEKHEKLKTMSKGFIRYDKPTQHGEDNQRRVFIPAKGSRGRIKASD